VARGDRAGLFCFDRSLDGFWRSFRAAAICYPLSFLLLPMRITEAQWGRSGGWRIIAVETIGYVISWVAFPLLMLTVTRWLGRAHRYFDFMVPYNWCQVPQSALFFLAGLAFESGMLGPQSDWGLGIVAIVGTLVYEWYVWYIARVSLETTSLAAVMIALLDFVLALLISRVSSSLY
jgi:hypothetical protein